MVIFHFSEHPFKSKGTQMKFTAGKRLLLPILGAIAINTPSVGNAATDNCVVDGSNSNTISGCAAIDYGLSPEAPGASRSGQGGGYSFQ